MKASEDTRQAALCQLAQEFERFSLDELRFDWCCHIGEDTRRLIRTELNRRGVSRDEFCRLGRGRKRETREPEDHSITELLLTETEISIIRRSLNLALWRSLPLKHPERTAFEALLRKLEEKA